MSKIQQIAEIYEGAANFILHYLGTLSAEKKAIAEQRLAICRDCPIRTGNLCDSSKTMKHVESGQLVKGCGCMIPMKVLSMSTACPKGEW